MEYPVDKNNPYDILYQKLENRKKLIQETEDELLIIDAAELLDEAEIIKQKFEIIVPVE